METIGIIFGIILLSLLAIVVGFLIYLPFKLVGEGVTHLGHKLQKWGEDESVTEETMESRSPH